jgi:hypothetical protein
MVIMLKGQSEREAKENRGLVEDNDWDHSTIRRHELLDDEEERLAGECCLLELADPNYKCDCGRKLREFEEDMFS